METVPLANSSTRTVIASFIIEKRKKTLVRCIESCSIKFIYFTNFVMWPCDDGSGNFQKETNVAKRGQDTWKKNVAHLWRDFRRNILRLFVTFTASKEGRRKLPRILLLLTLLAFVILFFAVAAFFRPLKTDEKIGKVEKELTHYHEIKTRFKFLISPGLPQRRR